MEYEVALRRVFDYQRFSVGQALSALIAETDSRLRLAPEGNELVDDSLDIWAAGQAYTVPKPPVKAEPTAEDI